MAIRMINKTEYPLHYATRGSAGFDIHSNMESFTLTPGKYRTVSTGLYLESVPGPLQELQIRPRSGLAAKNGLTVLNAPGTVDEDYPEEIKVVLINHDTSRSVLIRKGMRIAQGVIALVIPALGVEVLDVERTDGLGSTGV